MGKKSSLCCKVQWCGVNVEYEPPEDDPVRVETYVGVEE
jgi:hypothetical protein